MYLYLGPMYRQIGSRGRFWSDFGAPEPSKPMLPCRRGANFVIFHDYSTGPKKELNKTPKWPPGAAQEAPGAAQEAPRRPQEPPGAPQEGPKSYPNSASERPWRPNGPTWRPRALRRPPGGYFGPPRGTISHPPGDDFRTFFHSPGSMFKTVLWTELMQAYGQKQLNVLV